MSFNAVNAKMNVMCDVASINSPGPATRPWSTPPGSGHSPRAPPTGPPRTWSWAAAPSATSTTRWALPRCGLVALTPFAFTFFLRSPFHINPMSFQCLRTVYLPVDIRLIFLPLPSSIWFGVIRVFALGVPLHVCLIFLLLASYLLHLSPGMYVLSRWWFG
jgi:hypothetical protein